jgi:hypothetical protein
VQRMSLVALLFFSKKAFFTFCGCGMYVISIWNPTPIRMEGCVKFWNQSVKKFRRYKPWNRRTVYFYLYR